MVKRSLALLLTAALMAGASAQLSTGILYCCSMEENGANIPAGTNTVACGGPSPRSIYGTFSGAPSRENSACHNALSDSNCQQMFFSNGTVYPNNNGVCGGGRVFTPYDIAPTGCLTADNWGADPSQCKYPGFGRDPLFITNNGVTAPTNYPIMYDAKTTCNLAVMEQNLYDTANPSAIYGKMFAFKDYSDNLYITVSINASGFMPGQTGPSGGQFLLPNPSLPTNNFPTGLAFMGSSFPNGFSILQYAQYTTSQTLDSSVGQYSCFTMMIPLRQACPYETSTFVRGVGGSPSFCASRTTGAAVATIDLSSTVNLFFSAQFNVSKYITDANSCGIAPTTFCQTQTVTTSTGAIQWSALWMKVFFLDATLNTLFYNNLATNQGIIWDKIGAIAYPVGLSGAPNVPPPCGFFGMVHTSGPTMVSPSYHPAFPYVTQPTSAPFQPAHTSYPAAIMPYYACSANNVYNGNITNPQYFVPAQSASPAAFGIPDGINMPDGLNPAQPTLTYLPLVECSIITWPLFLANYANSSRMFILAGQFGLTCSDRVWANISGCPGLDDANVAFTGFPNPLGIPTGTGFPNATSVFYNQAACTSDGPGLMAAITTSVDITQGIQPPTSMVCTNVQGGLVMQISFMMQSDSMAFYNSITSAPGMTFFIFNARAANSLPCNAIIGVVDSTQRTAQFSCTPISGQVSTILPVLCCTSTPPPPAVVPTPAPVPVPTPTPPPTPVPVAPTPVPIATPTPVPVAINYPTYMMWLNGCAVVTPLPNPTGFVRVAYKFYFNLAPSDWVAVSAALDSLGAMRDGHVMCDSTVYCQTYTSPAINTRQSIDATTNPTWLAQSASNSVCYDDVFAPLH
ncbi:hypothetical protein FOA52_000327 [Chlamydomonas sp. UWO 241]|nr:hypothetical protein FOA52_000327 [Chlamydomonas sp. UWO 241]